MTVARPGVGSRRDPAESGWSRRTGRRAQLTGSNVEQGEGFGGGGPGAGGGLAAAGGIVVLVGLMVLLGLSWAWMAVSVPAASLARAEPLAGWRCVLIGLRRWLVGLGAWGVLLVAPALLGLVHLGARSMAGTAALSVVSFLLTLIVMLGVLLWVLAILLVSWFVAAFAAADLRAGVDVASVAGMGGRGPPRAHASSSSA